MNDIKCPKCNEVFKVDQAGYADILKQVRDDEFAQALKKELEQAERLSRSIASLTEPYRSLVVLRDIHQHSYEEVAGVLELSLVQVKVYLHRARKQLREQLAEVRP